MYVVFENEGLMDMRAVRTFGVSAKETDNPIGFFGTGLKYAIAILLREGCQVMIEAGRPYEFELKSASMRGKEFDVITMNGEELPYTTHLGTNWELWQAFRELYCNCLDEKGTLSLFQERPEPNPDLTRVIVRGEKFAELFFERESIVMTRKNAFEKTDYMEIHQGESQYLYYRGVRVHRLGAKSRFTYNIIATLGLTEDRTLQSISAVESYITRSVAKMENRDLIRSILTAEKDHFEFNLGYGNLTFYQYEIGPAFEEVMAEEYRANNDRLNASARRFHSARINRVASKHYEQVDLTPVEKKQMARAVEVCTKAFPDFGDVKVMVVKTLGQETMALADEENRTMVISRSTFERGTKYLASTMIEEFMHIKTGYGDLTRNLQTHLFDTICTLIENHVIQEPI